MKTLKDTDSMLTTRSVKYVSLPKLRLLVEMWAGRGEPNALTCAKELARTILPALSETEAAELVEAIEKQKAG